MKITKADNFYKRLIGLLRHQSLENDEGLLLTDCKRVHTIGMKFEISVVYLDENFQYLDKERLKPNKLGRKIRHCQHILEVSADNYSEIDEAWIRSKHELFI